MQSALLHEVIGEKEEALLSYREVFEQVPQVRTRYYEVS